MRVHYLLLTCAAPLLLCLFSGCHNGSHALEITQEAAPETGKLQVPVDNPGFALPTPSVLLGKLDGTKRSAYIESDLVKDGVNYKTSWPWQNIYPAGQHLVYTPNWTVSASSDASDLAYAIWEFLIPGYDRNAQIRYHWISPLGDPAEGWIALANWDSDRWDWYVSEADEKLDVGSLDPYFDPADRLVVVILRIGTAQSTLTEVRVGGNPPEAMLTAGPTRGMVPFTVSFDGTGSTDTDGSIVRYEWDVDGDGNYDVDNGTSPTLNHEYSEALQANAVLQVTDDDGLTDTERVEVIAGDNWVHTWGGSGDEEILDFVQVGSHLYCVGYSTTYVGDNTESLVLLKYNLIGELVWAKAFYGGTADAGTRIAATSDGGLIVVGKSSSWGGGGPDILVQKWNTDGTLQWSRVWGGSNYEIATGVALGGSDIYVCGHTNSYGSGDSDALFLKMNDNGTALWTRVWGGGQFDVANDIKRLPALGDVHNFRVTGETRSYGQGGGDVLLLGLESDGSVSWQYTWGDDKDQAGYGLRVGYLGEGTYVCGSTTVGSYEKLLLLEFSTMLTFTRKFWGRPGTSRADDIYYANGNFYLAGRYKQPSGNPLFKGIYMIVDDSTWEMLSSHYTDLSQSAEFYYIGSFSSFDGLYVGGTLSSAGGSFSFGATDAAADAPSIVWQEQTVTTQSIPDGALPTNGATIEDITTGVIDSGGGGKDGALAMRNI